MPLFHVILWVLAAFVAGGVVGFVAGALVYRNNEKAGNKIVQTGQDVANTVKKL